MAGVVLDLLTHTTCSHTTYSHATYSRTTCTHTTYSRRRGTWRHGSSLCVAGVPTCPRGRRGFLRGRRGTWTHNLSTVSRGNFAWQAWHFVTSTFTLCGRCGTLRGRHGTTCTHTITHAGVALGDMGRHFAWQAWHVWHWAGSGGALGSQRSPWSPRLFAWQAWHLATCSCTLRGRRGTLRHPPSFHVAGVARVALGWLWWELHYCTCHSRLAGPPRCDVVIFGTAVAADGAHVSVLPKNDTGSGGALGSAWNKGTPWQAWHLETSTFVSRGMRGTW